MAIKPGSQFYHGTHLDFNPGDLIQPRDVTGANPNFDPEPDFNHGDRAYAADHSAAALFYGIHSAEKNKKGVKEAKVYHVEPLDHDDLEWDDEGSIILGNAYSSKSGFRVVKRHGNDN